MGTSISIGLANPSLASRACGGNSVAYVHYKYVLGNIPGYSGPIYLRLTAKRVFSSDALGATYDGPTTLNQWVDKAGKYAGEEKSIVDLLVAKNDHVVDLEMALPAWTVPKVAVRMDLVAIENGKVVFWEVKTVDDGRIRCEAEFEEDRFPEVLKQLSNYRVFLEQHSHVKQVEHSHVKQVENAYLHAAKLLVKLRVLADKIGPALALGPTIIAASQADTLAVDLSAALVVVDLLNDPKGPAWTSWKASHEGKLKGKIPMLVLENPEYLKIADAQ